MKTSTFKIKYVLYSAEVKGLFQIIDTLSRLIAFHWVDQSPCLTSGNEEQATYNYWRVLREVVRDKIVKDYVKATDLNVHKAVKFFEGSANEFELDIQAAMKCPPKTRLYSIFAEWLRQFEASGFDLKDAKQIGVWKNKNGKTGCNSDLAAQHAYVTNYLATRAGGTTIKSIKKANKETEAFLATI